MILGDSNLHFGKIQPCGTFNNFLLIFGSWGKNTILGTPIFVFLEKCDFADWKVKVIVNGTANQPKYY